MSGTASNHIAHPIKRAYVGRATNQNQAEPRDGEGRASTTCVPFLGSQAVLPVRNPVSEPTHSLFIYSSSMWISVTCCPGQYHSPLIKLFIVEPRHSLILFLNMMPHWVAMFMWYNQMAFPESNLMLSFGKWRNRSPEKEKHFSSPANNRA